jgi:lysyl-tRNA synthetase class 1
VLLEKLLEFCKSTQEIDPNTLQNGVYAIAMEFEFDIKAWFSCIYRTLLGQSEGPRVGSFIALFGTQNMAKLIEEKLK